jgi:phosphatidylglycerol lysyltransferase
LARLVLAAAATWISFRAVAGYDLTLHRHLATGIAPDRARRAGFAAIAIGQIVGLGVVTGTLVRWRLLPELGLLGAARLSLLVAVSFLAARGVLMALVLSALPAACVAGSLGRRGGLGRARAWSGFPSALMPNLIISLRLLSLAAIDCAAAGLGLWMLPRRSRGS